MFVYEKSIFKGAELNISDGVAAHMCTDEVFDAEARLCLQRFLQQDWGDLSPQARRSNDLLLDQHLEPVLGLYNTSLGRVVVSASCYIQGQYEMVGMSLYKEVYNLYMVHK